MKIQGVGPNQGIEKVYQSIEIKGAPISRVRPHRRRESAGCEGTGALARLGQAFGSE